MPRKPKKPCRHSSCANLTEGMYCEEHKPLHRQDRASAVERGYDGRWRKARNRFLQAHPLCVKCKEEGKLVKADVVDHIKPHRGRKEWFWDERNWQPLCQNCHNKKTWNEERYPVYGYEKQGEG